MKKILSLSVIVAVLLMFLSCGSKKSENTDNTKEDVTNENKISDEKLLPIFEVIDKLPVFNVGAHIYTADGSISFEGKYEGGKGKLVGEPVCLSSEIIETFTDSVFIIESEYLSKNVSLAEYKENINSQNDNLMADDIEICFYCVLDINNGFTNVLATLSETLEGEFQSKDWYIYTINKEGKIISEIGRFDDIYLMDKEIVSLWFYASDPKPTYEFWRQNQKGYFDMYKYSEYEPKGFKSF